MRALKIKSENQTRDNRNISHFYPEKLINTENTVIWDIAFLFVKHSAF